MTLLACSYAPGYLLIVVPTMPHDYERIVELAEMLVELAVHLTGQEFVSASVDDMGIGITMGFTSPDARAKVNSSLETINLGWEIGSVAEND